MSHGTKAIYASWQRNNLSNVESISSTNVIICTYTMYEQDVLRLHPTIHTVHQWRADRCNLSMMNLDTHFNIQKPRSGKQETEYCVLQISSFEVFWWKIVNIKILDIIFFLIFHLKHDRLCGLVVRVLGYRSGGPCSIPGTTKKKVVGLERGPLSLVSTTEELLDRKVAAPV
jgi:hypothetical protein